MRKLTLIIILISLFIVPNASSQVSFEQTMSEFETKIDWLYYKMALENWDKYTTGQADSLEFYRELYYYLINNDQLIQNIKNSASQAANSVDKRRLELTEDLLFSKDIDGDKEIALLKDSISNIDITFRADFEGAKHLSNDLYKIYRTDNDRTRREAAYRAYISIGEELQEPLSRLFRMRNNRASKEGFNNYFALALKEKDIDQKEYEALLKRLDSISSLPYQNVLEKIKASQRRNDIEIWDLAFANKSVNIEIDRYFPVDSQLNFVKNSLKDIGFDLNKLPIYFDLDSRDGKSQYAYAFNIKPPHEMRVMANLSNGLQSTFVLMHEVGHVIFSGHIKQDSPLFSLLNHPAWDEGMAQIIGQMVYDPKWLKGYAHVPEGLVRRFLEAKADSDIIYLRSRLVQLYFELEAYRNPNRDLNELYWNLSEKYMMLPKHTDMYPWASMMYYNTHPVYLQNYLFADIISAQTKSFFTDNFGSLIGNATTKSFLVQNYYRFGARYDWHELLLRGTDSELNPDYLINALGL